MDKKFAYNKYDKKEIKKVNEFASEYRKFISDCKTERECCIESVKLLKEAGFEDIQDVIKAGRKLKSGDKVYAVCMGKQLVAFRIGKQPLEKGMNILGAHIDSPRIDLKQNPLYERDGLAFFDTHYYGGIKKYQWVTLPLAIHGVVAKKDGTVVNVVIGEDVKEPVVGITDILIHLAAKQMDKKASVAVEGENLDVLIGSNAKTDKDGEPKKDGVKAAVLEILKKKYGIEEEDFLSAELEVVPAGPARDFGLDASMIMGYGHDDRVCAYPSLKAILNVEKVEKTSVLLLVDKEEIGSVGATGMQSRFFENMVAEVLELLGESSPVALRRALMNSCMLSSDVSAGLDPLYEGMFEKKNAAFIGAGLVFNKYTGSRGKSGSNDANAEYIASLRNMLDNASVTYQTAELGRVDEGGGGTIAYICANLGMQVIDSGIAVLSMHAPWEIIHKADLYEAEKGYEVFLTEAGK